MKRRMGGRLKRERVEDGIEMEKREREREMGEVVPDLSTAPKADLPVRPLVNYTVVLVLKHRYHNCVDYHKEK